MVTTPEPASAQPESPPPPARRGPWSILWRLAAVAAVVIVTIAGAHFLRHPARLQGGAAGGADGTQGEWPAIAKPGAPPSDAPPGAAQAATKDLRRLLGGFLAGALEEDGDFEDPRNQDPEARRRFIEDRFGLPTGYPRGAAPTDLVPKDAQILMVFDSPDQPGTRMVLLRIRKGVEEAMADMHKQYAAAGWKVAEPIDPKAQTDRGWLVRFTRTNEERIVYARARHTGEETLAAVYDSRY